MRNEKELNVDVHTRALKAADRTVNGNGKMHGSFQAERQWWQKFLPHGRYLKMTQEAKGVFIPYPLLGIIITLCTILVGGIIAIQVQVSNLSTTLLLRDADQRAAVKKLEEKTEQLQVYIHDDREKLIRLLERTDQAERERRR